MSQVRRSRAGLPALTLVLLAGLVQPAPAEVPPAPAAATPPAPAPPAPAPPAGCSSSEHHQFDFWAGTWDVLGRDGKVAGTNTIAAILGGCVLQEHWRGAKGMEGMSLNMYDATDGRWHQTWMDSGGSQLLLAGGLRDGRMILEGESKSPQGRGVRDRITWSPQEGGKVRQLWEQSTDGGATWTTAFDGLYVPHR